MKIALVPIGNSKGVRIPKAILEQCHFTKEIDLSVEGDAIILKPVKHKARQHWDAAFKVMHARGEDKLLVPDHLDLVNGEWEW